MPTKINNVSQVLIKTTDGTMVSFDNIREIELEQESDYSDYVSECRNCDRPKEMDMACKTCKYWQYEEIDQGHVCVNDDSYYLAEWTDKDNYCERWTPMANEK